MPKRPIAPEDLLRLSFVSDVQLHPSGGMAIFCVKTVKSPSAYRSRIYSVIPGQQPEETTRGDVMDTRPRWAPDGHRLAFVSNREKKQAQIYLIEGYGEPRKLTNFPDGSLGAYKWSPDGTRLAVLYRVKSSEWTQDAIETRKKEERSDPPREITRWPYRLDGDGLFNDDRFELYLVDAKTGAFEKVELDTDLSEVEFDWSPDGKKLALAFKPGKQKFLEPPLHEAFILDLETKKLTHVETPPGVLSSLSWSHSGAKIALVFDDRSKDPWGPKRSRVGLIDTKTLAFEPLMEDSDVFVESLVIGDSRDPAETELFWLPEDSGLIFQLAVEGNQHIAHLPLGGKIELLTEGFRGEIHLTSVSEDGSCLGCYVTTPTAPAEVFMINRRNGKVEFSQVTDLNRTWVDEVEIYDSEESWQTSPDGTSIQTWTIRNPEAKRPQPVVVLVHGGPAAMYSCAFFFEMQVLASHGFVVVFSNPRGSTGYGEAFCRAILGNWGEKDWMDVQTVTNYAASLPDVDTTRISIAGGSYGGFMVNWAIGHTDRYYRAVTDRCVSNLLSKWGNSDYMFVPNGHWPGSIFGDRERLTQCSPIVHFADVKTPTLIIHSEGDLRCPIEQGEQVFAALKILGVETKFVRYPASTSHGLSRSGPPDLRVHRIQSILDWLMR